MRIILLLCILMLVDAASAAAQSIRYIGSAIADFVEDEGRVSEAHAGGGSAETADNITFCDERLDCCFDQPSGCGGVVSASSSRTFGGAGESVGATPGFPRVSSRAGVISIPLDSAVVSISGVQAIADSDGDADNDEMPDDADNDGKPDPGLVTSCGVVTVTTDEDTQEIIPELNIDVPVTESSIARCVRVEKIRDGLSQIEVVVTLVDVREGNPEFLRATALAGVEIPFESGGSCAISPRTRGVDGSTAATLGLLWILARRRQRIRK